MTNAPDALMRHLGPVAANVRAEAARAGISQQAVGDALGLSQAGVSRRLSGKVDFSATELTKLAEVLNVPVSTFFGEHQPRPKAVAS